MQTKIFSSLAAVVLTALTAASAFAAGEYLPDVENVAAALADNGAKITWDAVTGADQYTLYYGTTSIATDGASYENSTLLGNVTEYTLTDLTPETTYYFAVAADDSTGKYLGSFNYSQEVSITTGVATTSASQPTAPDPVVDPAAASITPEPVATEPTPSETNPTSDPVNDLVGGELYPSGSNEQTPPPVNLPKSGPEAAVALLLSGTGTYFWRRYFAK
ncbi:MAG: fibronectin type III domain-containing protein [Patescibacteria group bacterium]